MNSPHLATSPIDDEFLAKLKYQTDPSILWQAMRDLIGASAEEVAAKRAGRHRRRWRAASRLQGAERRWGGAAAEPRVELQPACPDAAAGHGSRSANDEAYRAVGLAWLFYCDKRLNDQ